MCSAVFTSDTAGSLLCRPVIKHVVQYASQHLPHAALDRLWRHLFGVLRGRAGAYEEEEVAVREQLAASLIAAHQYADAARCLEDVDTTSEQALSLDPTRLARAGRAIRLYIKAGNIPAAEVQMTRICGALDGLDPSSELWLDLQTSYAEILKRTLASLKAAGKFFDVSRHPAVKETHAECAF